MARGDVSTETGTASAQRNVGAVIRAVPTSFGQVLREQWAFVAIALCYLLFAGLVGRSHDKSISFVLYGRQYVSILASVVVAHLIYRIIRVIVKERPDRPLGRVWADLKGDATLGRRMIWALPPFTLLPLVLSAFTSIKQSIPETVGFVWDETFARWDAWLHGGEQPWVLLQPLLGQPWITQAIDQAYSRPWVWMLILMQLWIILSYDPRRLRLLLTFTLSWILLGSVAASFLGSAGPAYYGRLVEGPDPFAPLLSYLHSVDDAGGLFAVGLHEYLWESYQAGYLQFGAGISAMPSMHVGITCLFVIMVWPWHWALRCVALGYLLVVLVGSVHLGWHYAIDGYVSILCVVLIWRLTGRLTPARAHASAA